VVQGQTGIATWRSMGDLRDTRRYIYRLDATDRIVWVNDAWLAFARENDAAALAAETVLYRPLWDFITNTEVQHLYGLIFDKVRSTGSVVTLPFRCDSPTRRRFMELVVGPEPQQTLNLASRLLWEEPREPVALLEAARPHSERFLTICSWCKRVLLAHGQWAEVEVAMRSLDTFQEPVLPRLTHGICPSCRTAQLALARAAS